MKNNKKNIKCIISMIIPLFLLLTSFQNFAIADNNNIIIITKTYTFEKPKINDILIYGEIYDKITVTNLISDIGNPGEPNLPSYDVSILLPPKTELKDINIIVDEKIYLGSGFNVDPVLLPRKLTETEDIQNIDKKQSVYDSNQPYPNTYYSNIKNNTFRGFEIITLILHPIQYKPFSGELYYYKNMTISINAVEKKELNHMFRNLLKDQNEIIKKIDNHLTINNYIEYLNNINKQHLTDSYDLLILTIDEFKDKFAPLKNIHDLYDIKTEIKTIEDIQQNSGEITPEDIRNFIKEEYKNYGIEYVLIGGDDDIVPSRELWVESMEDGKQVYMPSDLYYSCLDGPYNYDGDEKWGEPNDGENGNDVDLFADVYVGRACVGNLTEIENFVNKTIYIINKEKNYNDKVLMVGELLWESPETWGSDYMNELINGSSNNFYTTIGIPWNRYKIETLYDYNWPNNDWPKSEIINKINNGTDIINHLGHATNSYNMKMAINDISSIKNDEPFFIYSQGCNSGAFDISDCIGEYLNVKTKYGAYAIIMNARSGWGVAGGTSGASQMFHRAFWDAVFGENITEIGKANQDSKEDLISRINYPGIRWCYYQLNLLGDPTISFFDNQNTPPNTPQKPIGNKIGKTNKEYNFITISNDENSDLIYYKWDWGDETKSEWVGPFNSNEEALASHKWLKMGKYQIRVKTIDEHRGESEWSESCIITVYKSFEISNIIESLKKFFSNYFIFDT